MEIKVLGPGCSNCKRVEKVVTKALNELNIEAKISKVTDFKDIASFGVMSTPGLVVNGEVKLSGKVPSLEEVKTLLQ
ncbi:thioredoxin family protein [Amphibacillus cookii]|uniref:thioredoxin family protein n=1 Tax=Amphibacillus cookii TaxID=767787 RepID=UPI00195DEF92|nr:thioredoxin family protein [Amphibacillus cookii]MBM7541643.1 small redox-active disulfide protein 2 [Amphibacillus cookii]